MLDKALAEGCTADEAEARASEQVWQLGRKRLGDWAQEKQAHSLAQARPPPAPIPAEPGTFRQVTRSGLAASWQRCAPEMMSKLHINSLCRLDL
jgi:hypothetical protein